MSEHACVNRGILVAGEPDEADFSGALRFEHGFHRAAVSEDAIGIFETDHLVMLQQVDAIGVKPLETLVDLARR